MNRSENIDKVSKALALAQSEISGVEHDKVNPFVKSTYASLGAILKVIKPVLEKHGLSIIQFPVGQGSNVGLENIILHDSGQYISNELLLEMFDEKGKSRAQVAGSVISYLRRYSLGGIMNIYTDEDVDANQPKEKAGSKKKSEPTKVKPKRPYEPKTTKARLQKVIEGYMGDEATDNQRKTLPIWMSSMFPEGSSDASRHAVMHFLTGEGSTNDLIGPEVLALIKWVNPDEDNVPDQLAIAEANKILRHIAEEQGQKELM